MAGRGVLVGRGVGATVGRGVTRAVGTGVAAAGGTNFDLDWFTLGNHGGSGNRDCRFSDTSAYAA